MPSPRPTRRPTPHAAPEATPARPIPTEPSTAVRGIERLFVERGDKVLVDGGGLGFFAEPLGLGLETGLFESGFLGGCRELARDVGEGVVVAHCVVNSGGDSSSDSSSSSSGGGGGRYFEDEVEVVAL